MKQLGPILPFLLLAVVFYLLLIRPQRRRSQELGSVQKTLEPGAEVMLGSGIFGTVSSVEDDKVRLEVAPGTIVTVARQAVVRRVDTSPTTTDLSAGSEEPAPNDTVPSESPVEGDQDR